MTPTSSPAGDELARVLLALSDGSRLVQRRHADEPRVDREIVYWQLGTEPVPAAHVPEQQPVSGPAAAQTAPDDPQQRPPVQVSPGNAPSSRPGAHWPLSVQV
jgi:hypothetical protein